MKQRLPVRRGRIGVQGLASILFLWLMALTKAGAADAVSPHESPLVVTADSTVEAPVGTITIYIHRVSESYHAPWPTILHVRLNRDYGHIFWKMELDEEHEGLREKMGWPEEFFGALKGYYPVDGFYPSPCVPMGEGEVKEHKQREYSHQYIVPVDAARMDTAVNFTLRKMANPPEYHLYNYNCATMVVELLEEVGDPWPGDPKATFGIPYFCWRKGVTPGTMAYNLEQLVAKREATTADAPNDEDEAR